MNAKQMLDEILAVLQTVKDDKNKLQVIHKFMFDEIYEDPQEEEIPEKYKKVVADIADSLIAGLHCFLNPETMVIDTVPQGLINDPSNFEMLTGYSEDEFEKDRSSWKQCIEVEPLHSNDSFRIMEYFADEVKDEQLQRKLINALNNRKPFANFKWLIDNSEYRQNWFHFRQKEYEKYVWREIGFEMEKFNG